MPSSSSTPSSRGRSHSEGPEDDSQNDVHEPFKKKMRENRNALSQVLKDSRNSKSIKQVSFQEQMIALDKEDHAMKKEDMELRKQLVDKFKNSEKQFNDALRALKANHQ